MHETILFLCTGNYYRSRFAEELFNHLAQRDGLPWRAASRGLATELAAMLEGPISKETIKALQQRGVLMQGDPRKPVQCCDADLTGAAIVVALKEAEHRPLLTARHAGWEDRVRYWHVHDLDGATPDQAMSEIEQLVRALVDELKTATPTR